MAGPGGATTWTATSIHHAAGVATLVINADGSYTFTQLQPLVHPTNTGLEENLNVAFAFTVTDGDNDTATGQLTVQINDDMPIAIPVTATPTLDDEAQTLFVGNLGNPPGGSGDVSPDVKTTSGGIGSLFSAGADGLKSIGFTDPTTLKAIYQDANGFAAQESLTFATKTDATVAVGHTIYTATGVTSGNTVFTLDVAADGSYTFTVSEPLVHPTASGTVEENLAVTIGFTVTDGDGDTAVGSLTVQVNDDTPVANTVTNTSPTDDEGKGDFAPGNTGAQAGDVPGQPSTATGGVGALFSAGADGVKSVDVTTFPSLSTIYKDGFAHTEVVTWGSGVAGPGGATTWTAMSIHHAAGVATLVINADGSYTFTQLQPLVHPTNGGSEENLNVAFAFTVTDGDGDTATGSLTVQVNDDMPVANTVTAAPVLDDDAQTLFPGNPDGTGDVADATVATGVAGALFSAGADGLQSISFTPDAALKAIFKDATGLAAQETLNYATTTAAGGHTILTATGATSGHTVFTLDVAGDGSYRFTALEPLVSPTVGTTEENLPVVIGFTVTDGDGDTATGQLTVNVNDDTPVASTVTAAPILDDEAQTLFPGNDVPADGVANVKVATGVAGALFSAGADGLQSISFTNPTGLEAIYKDASGLAAQETLNYATTVVAGHTILTATGVISLNVVFTLDVASNGSYTFTASEPLVHPTNSATEENLPVVIGFTVTDGDGDRATGQLTVNVNDDTPVANTVTAATVLDDDAQILFRGNPGGTGDVANATVATGVAGALFSAGADGLKSISFTAPTLSTVYKDANGLAAQEVVTFGAPVTSAGGVTTLTGTSVHNGTVVTLVVNADGSYTFTAFAPLVSPTVGTTEENLPVVIGFTVTDGDGDTATGQLTVNVNDDTPVANTVTAAPTLDDEAQTLLPGNPGGTGDVADATVATGAAGALFSAGADGLQSVSFTPDIALKAIYQDANGFAAQESLTYATTTAAGGHTILTATGATSGHTVFTLDVAADGSYTFTVSEPLVHPTNSATEENLPVVIGFTVTDGDNDTATGSLTVNVNDDTPVANTVTAATVLDDEAQTLFPGNDVPADGVANVKVATGVAGALFSAGADGLQSISFTNPTGLKAIYKDASGLAHGAGDAELRDDDGSGWPHDPDGDGSDVWQHGVCAGSCGRRFVHVHGV